MPKKHSSKASVKAGDKLSFAPPQGSIRKNYLFSKLWLFLSLGLLILVFYSNSFNAGLLFDSDTIIRLDPRLRGLHWANMEQIFTHDYWWPSDQSVLYRPLTTFSYLFNYTILGNGEEVGGYHLVNFLLHWTNAWLVLLIVRRLSDRLDVAVLTACLFAVHPVNTEAVTNVVGRADLLSTLCILFGGWCYLRAALAGASKGKWLAAMGIAECLGVLAKENGVMLVGFVALYDALWQMPPSPPLQVKFKTVFQKFAQGYVALLPGLLLIWLIRRWVMSTTMVFEDFFTDNPLVGAAPLQLYMTAVGIIGRYLKLLVFPRALSADYSFNQIPLYGTGNPASDTAAWISIIVVILLLGSAIYLRFRQKLFSWGVFFFFIMLLPTSDLVVTIGSIMAERFLYLPSIGFCAAAAVVLCGVTGKAVTFMRAETQSRVLLRWTLPAAIVCLLGIRTFLRNADWRDDLSLWKSAVAASPASFKAHMVYGDAIVADAEQKKNRPLEQAIDDAIPQEEIARSILESEPPLPLKWLNINVYLHLAKDYRIKGQLLEDNGHRDQATNFYNKSLEVLIKAQEIDRSTNQASREFRLRRGISPQDLPDVGNFLLYESLCLTYSKLGQWEKCEVAARYLEHIAPHQPSAYRLAGAAYFNVGRYSEAAVQFLCAFFLDPDKDEWLRDLSGIYDNMGVQPNPVVSQDGKLFLKRDSSLVREHFNAAAATLVRLFEEARKRDEAAELRDKLIRLYSVPPDVFARKS